MNRRALLHWSDLWRMPARLSFAMHLARAAMHDPVAFGITAAAVRRHRALQKPLELFAYLSFLRGRPIERSMEIGTFWGGTFYAHCAITAPNGHMIAIDSFPREDASLMTSRLRRLARANQTVTGIWSDSHSDRAFGEVGAALNGAPLDLLFLDGDHSSDGVRRDYEMYSPLVREGGVIAFHDIDKDMEGGVPAFWRSVRSRHESVEFVDRAHPPQGLGIGAIVKGANP